MKTIALKAFLFLGFLTASISSFSQCEILNRVRPDGSMVYYMEPVNFYWTKAKDLKGCVYTDKENYFIAFYPSPFPEKQLGKKIKGDLNLKLANNKDYRLNHYDTRYLENDSIMELLYLIDKRDLNDVLNFQVTAVEIDMKDTEGLRTYVFKLHKSAIQEQLACFLKFAEEKKEK
jgi:hypothetical protein